MRAFSSGAFGSGQRLPATGFVVFGLLTFWIFTVLSFASALRGHLDLRWKEFSARESLKGADAVRLEAVRREGFSLSWAAPALVAAMLAGDALWVAAWFYRWILSGDALDYGAIMLQVGGSAVLFYAAILTLFLWTLGMVRRHELAELLLHEAGAAALGENAPVAAGALLDRWERQAGEVSLFLVVAVPLTFSPAIGAHLFLGGSFERLPLLLPAACFAFAAMFHVWGTLLLLKLYNSHLECEATHIAPAPATRPATPLDPRRASHHDVFLSHSAKDKPVADAICARLEQSGIRVWIAPRDIQPGANWGEAIIEALEGCRAMVIVFSASANASPQVLREVERAVGKGVAVIPFRIEDVKPSKAMEYFLSSPHWLDALTPPLEAHVDALVASVGALLRAAEAPAPDS